MTQLKGIVFNHACGLNQYMLGREPWRFQYLRTLVDSCHYSGKERKGETKKVGLVFLAQFNVHRQKNTWKEDCGMLLPDLLAHLGLVPI